jgi:FtsH-binding integral membrane protein
MKKVNDKVNSAVMSSTKNVLLAVVGIYLLYLLGSFISNNGFSFETVFPQIKEFAFENLGKFFVGWLIIFAWTICTMVKLDKTNTGIPKVFSILFFATTLIGSIILFMVTSASTHEGITIFSFVLGCLLLIVCFGLCIVHSMPDTFGEYVPPPNPFFEQKREVSYRVRFRITIK